MVKWIRLILLISIKTWRAIWTSLPSLLMSTHLLLSRCQAITILRPSPSRALSILVRLEIQIDSQRHAPRRVTPPLGDGIALVPSHIRNHFQLAALPMHSGVLFHPQYTNEIRILPGCRQVSLDRLPTQRRPRVCRGRRAASVATLLPAIISRCVINTSKTRTATTSSLDARVC